MILFPLIATLLLLTLLAQLALVAREALREHRVRPHHHPTLRAVAVLTLIELVLVVVWAVLVGRT